MKTFFPLALQVVLLGFMLTTAQARADVIDVSSLKPSCPKPYSETPVNGTCKVNPNITEKDCNESHGKYSAGTCTLEGKAPSPQCIANVPDLMVKGEVCVIDRKVPRSAVGDYVGDYFEIKARSQALAGAGVQNSARLKVLSQQPLGEDDKLLTVIAVKEWKAFGGGYEPINRDEILQVKASDLIDAGATRHGWAYGVLALPFKYYASDKSMASGLSLGPYFGRQVAAPGSIYTIAVAAALSSVKGEVRDADNKITSTPDLQAFSVAVGTMWSISKAPKIKPFKIGLFVGLDSVRSDDVVKFKNNRKAWVAFQVGFDFTDN